MRRRWFTYVLGLTASSLVVLVMLQNSINYKTELKLKLYKTQRTNYYFGVVLKRNISQPSENLENVPNAYLQAKKLPKFVNKTCAIFPKLVDLKFTANHWQIERTSLGTLHLFNAYLDRREFPRVRIVAMLDAYSYNNTFQCQFWYDQSDKPVVVSSEKVYWMWNLKWGGTQPGVFHPYLVSCPLPNKQVPIAVSVVERPCANATNSLRISNVPVQHKDKKDFVVCVKGLNFPYEDLSLRLIEWIELLFILGADKITFYEFSIHPSVKEVLNYYQNLGKVEVVPITLIGDVSNTPFLQSKFLHDKLIHRRLQEVIPYNDCLYRNLDKFKFIVLLDTDEVIVPQNNTWHTLMDAIKNPNATSYMARNVYFLDSHQHDHHWHNDIPQYMHMLQHVTRARNYTKPNAFVKGFHDADKVTVLHNHYPFNCFKNCRPSSIDTNLAHLQHYRNDCVKGVKECELMKTDSVQDFRIWNYKEALVPNMLKVLSDLGYRGRGSQS